MPLAAEVIVPAQAHADPVVAGTAAAAHAAAVADTAAAHNAAAAVATAVAPVVTAVAAAENVAEANRLTSGMKEKMVRRCLASSDPPTLEHPKGNATLRVFCRSNLRRYYPQQEESTNMRLIHRMLIAATAALLYFALPATANAERVYYLVPACATSTRSAPTSISTRQSESRSNRTMPTKSLPITPTTSIRSRTVGTPAMNRPSLLRLFTTWQ